MRRRSGYRFSRSTVVRDVQNFQALRVNDVQEIERVPCFAFIEDKKIGKRLKSATAVRIVPIHPQLGKLGWLEHVDAVRLRDGDAAWLSPEISPQAQGALKAWTKWFIRYLRDAGVKDRRKVFHSFRHTFKDALRTAGAFEDLHDALLGQKHSSVGRGLWRKAEVRCERHGAPLRYDEVKRCCLCSEL